MILKNNCEIVGDLVKVKIGNGKIKFLFSINQEYEIPQSAFSILELKKYVGERVGVINIDGKVYRIRRIFSNKKTSRE